MKNCISYLGLAIVCAVLLFVAANLIVGIDRPVVGIDTPATNSPPAQYSGIIPFPPPKPPEC